jgi:uncharacterized protein DUF1501
MLKDKIDLSRRDLLKLATAGAMGGCMSGWLNVLAARAAQSPQARHKRCILLWMDGGPSHKDTFDPKPGTANSGPFRPIATSVPGIQISENFPQFARHMQHAAILRGMSTAEGAHGRARYYMHTGYREGQGGLVYPSLGALVAKEIGNPESPLPNFVSVGGRGFGSGFLGARHQPLVVNDPTRGVENLRPLVSGTQFENRVGLLEEMEQGFFRTYGSESGSAHQTTYRRAVHLMQSREARAFDLSQETAATRTAYGNTRFGDSCLLARRLVEVGVSFVEVTLGGWDTHQNNNERVRRLCGQVDPAMSTLVTDLQQRGLLNDTLVVWMGEFGRTPRLNQRGAQPGRDHYPRAWSTVLVGGGIHGGQVVGRTDAEGATVTDRRVSAIDFMATVCRVLGVDQDRMNTTPAGRPIRIVERGANPVRELFG